MPTTEGIRDREGLIKWLRRIGNIQNCPDCKGPFPLQRPLIKATFYCEKCEHLWRYRSSPEPKKQQAVWYKEKT